MVYFRNAQLETPTMRFSMVLDSSPQKQTLKEDMSLIDLLGDSGTMSQREGKKTEEKDRVCCQESYHYRQLAKHLV